jgi:hypothetical protein
LADQKLSALTADATPSSDDLVYTVNDPGGTPASRKVTIANLNAALDHGSLAGIADDDHTQYLLADGTRAATLLDVDNLRLDANTLSSTDANGDILLDPNGTGDVEVVSGNLLLANPLAVAEGGTGAATLTDGGVLLGSGTGAISATALGTSGQVLTSNGAGLDPTFQDAGAGSGDFVGPASATDNAVVRFDTTTGKLGQDSAIVIPDAVGSVAFLASKIGNALTVEVTEPAATTGASVAGNALTLNAGDAVASTDTAGAATPTVATSFSLRGLESAPARRGASSFRLGRPPPRALSSPATPERASFSAPTTSSWWRATARSRRISERQPATPGRFRSTVDYHFIPAARQGLGQLPVSS